MSITRRRLFEVLAAVVVAPAVASVSTPTVLTDRLTSHGVRAGAGGVTFTSPTHKLLYPRFNRRWSEAVAERLRATSKLSITINVPPEHQREYAKIARAYARMLDGEGQS